MGRVDDEAPGLIRHWFDFDVSDLGPPESSGITLDGGTRAYRLCGLGVGVTGFDREDCIALIESHLGGEPVPPITNEIRDVDVSAITLPVGVAAWRGIWSPPLNTGGPVTA
jgi:hypothetical protein